MREAISEQIHLMIEKMKRKTLYISPELETIVLDGELSVCRESNNDEYNQISGGSWDA